MKNNSNTFWLLVLVGSFLVGITSCTEPDPPTEPEPNELQAEKVFRPLVHHFSSTGCGPCGRFGIPLLNTVAAEMGDTVVPLITHFKYEDPFITPSSLAIEAAMLEAWYSPQIWINSDNITFDILYDDLPVAIRKTKEMLRAKTADSPDAFIGFKSEVNEGGRFDIELVVENNKADSAQFFVEIYGMEDSLVASQSGADPYVSTHFKVNRGGHFGEMGKELNLASNEVYRENLEFIPCWVCPAEKTYFYVIVWKIGSDGKYDYVNGLVRR